MGFYIFMNDSGIKSRTNNRENRGEPLLCRQTVNGLSSKGFQGGMFCATLLQSLFFHSCRVLNALMFPFAQETHHHCQTAHTLFDNDQLRDAFPSDRLDCIAQFSKTNRKKLAATRQSTETI